MVVIHFPCRNNINKLITSAVSWPIIFLMVFQNKPFSNAKLLMVGLWCFSVIKGIFSSVALTDVDFQFMELMFTIYDIKILRE